MPGIGIGLSKLVRQGTLLNQNQPEVDAYIAGLTTPLSSSQITKLNTLVKSLKTGLGISVLSDIFDVMYILGGETSESSLKNLVKNEHHATAVNSPVFTAFEGFAGNGINSYLNTGYIPSLHGVNYALNNASFGVYTRSQQVAGDKYIIGGRESSSSKVNVLGLRMSAGVVRGVVNYNDVTANADSLENSETPGFYTVNRYSESGYLIFKNYDIFNDFPLRASSGVTNVEMFILGCNNGGSLIAPTTSQASFVFFGRNLSRYENNILCSAINEYMKSNDKSVINSEPFVFNAVEMLLEDFSGYNQPYHPSVIFIPDGFMGYKYWLSQTPYPVGGLPYRDRWECPIVYKSLDGNTWESVANPLDDLTESEIINKDYFSDSHILYRHDLGRIEVWYRIAHIDGINTLTTLLRKTSTDGINWSQREQLLPTVLGTSIDNPRSPSILWDGSKYNMWYTSDHGKFLKTSVDGITWSERTQLIFNSSGADWHIDVNYFNGKYHYIGYNIQLNRLTYCVSSNGINFKLVSFLLSSSNSSGLYSNGLYRAVSMLDENNKVRLYSSGVNSLNKTVVFLVSADSLNAITDI